MAGIKLIGICSGDAINPYFVSTVSKSPRGIGCRVTMVGDSRVIESNYSYEYTCKLLSTDQTIGDLYKKWKPSNENVEIP